MTAPSFSLPYTATDADGDKLTVSPSPEIGIARRKEGALVQTVGASPASIGVFVSKEEAPRVALAVLISAGINPDAHGNALESAAATLASIQARQERAAKLEADALELYNALTASTNGPALVSFDGLPATREAWLQVAKTARKQAAQDAA
jgi:hypothetical protein